MSKAFSNPPPVVSPTDSPEAQWEVEKIVADKMLRGRVKYKVRWLGYSAASDEWIDAEELRQDAPDVVADYEKAKSARRRDRPVGQQVRKARARVAAVLASLSLRSVLGGVGAGSGSQPSPRSSSSSHSKSLPLSFFSNVTNTTSDCR
jgi:hypothetical protein